jgi:DNA-binding protein YbaB
MVRELSEAWVEQAIARHRWHERLQAEFDARLSMTEVSVQSPDELVEVRVAADGSVRQVNLVGPLHGRTNVEVSRSIAAALGAAADAADWARRTLYADLFGRYPPRSVR